MSFKYRLVSPSGKVQEFHTKELGEVYMLSEKGSRLEPITPSDDFSKEFLLVYSWSGILFTLLGALFTTFNISPIAALFFALGNIFWFRYGMMIKDKSIIIMNVSLFSIFLVGIVRSFLV
jgi:Sugar efflux transporter for intercellular exchange